MVLFFFLAPWQETFADARYGDGDGDGNGDGGTNRDQNLYHHPIYGKTIVGPFRALTGKYVYKPNLNFLGMGHIKFFSSIRKTAYQPFGLH